MKTRLFVAIFFLVRFFSPHPSFSQSAKASQYLDLIPVPPATLAEAQSRWSENEKDIEVQMVWQDIESHSDTTSPYAYDERDEVPSNNLLSAKSAVDYSVIRKELLRDWATVEDSIVYFLSNPKFQFQNTIVAIGENLVKGYERCSQVAPKKRGKETMADSACAIRVEREAREKREKAISDYLNTLRQNWGKYIELTKWFVTKHENGLDAVRLRTIEAKDAREAKRIDATLLAAVKLALQLEEEATKSVIYAAMR